MLTILLLLMHQPLTQHIHMTILGVLVLGLETLWPANQVHIDRCMLVLIICVIERLSSPYFPLSLTKAEISSAAVLKVQLLHSKLISTCRWYRTPYMLLSGPRAPPEALLPSRLPPPWSVIDDIFPFLTPLRTMYRNMRNKLEDEEVKRRRARKKRHGMHEDNLPLQIQLYFSAYVS